MIERSKLQILMDDPKAGEEYFASLTDAEIQFVLADWSFIGRPSQHIPDGEEWATWLYMGGRGAGKTRTGAEVVRHLIGKGYNRLGLIAPTASDARDVMVEGESGVLNVCRPWDRDHLGRLTGVPTYEPSKRRLTWATGQMATLYSADEPERLRGPQHEFIWADEIAAWKYTETWDLAQFGLRLGRRPWSFATTTPKPKPFIRDLIRDPGTVMTVSSTYANRSNLAPSFFKNIIRKYEGTRLGEQELLGRLLEQAEGALWNRELLDTTRRHPTEGEWFTRIVVAIDPAVTAIKNSSNQTGIVVAGITNNDHGYVLADYSGTYSPAQWAKKAKQAFTTWQADRIVAESNQGGDMVKHTIHTEDKNLPVTLVHAARGKQARAEPVAALFEQNRAHIAGSLPTLEDQLCTWEPLSGDGSPDRLDAMVWALTDCMIGDTGVSSSKITNAY